MIAIVSIIILFSVNEGVHANPKNALPSFEERFAEVGYKPVEESVKEFENYFKRDVKLPEIMPSISFTHKFGRFYEDKKYKANDSLGIMFVNKDLSENVYKIDIRPLENKLSFEGEEHTLRDGSKAIYFEDQLFNFLVFEENNLQYILGIHKRVSNIKTPETLIRIANSVI